MLCPVCETSITDVGVSSCPQCDSDLEIFGVMQNLETPAIDTKLSAQNLKIKKERSLLVYFGILFSVGVVGVLLGLVYHVQFSILEELRNERSNRIQAEERTAKITEKLTNQIIADAAENAVAQRSVISSLAQTSQDQANTIQKLNILMDKLYLAKKRGPKEKMSRTGGRL